MRGKAEASHRGSAEQVGGSGLSAALCPPAQLQLEERGAGGIAAGGAGPGLPPTCAWAGGEPGRGPRGAGTGAGGTRRDLRPRAATPGERGPAAKPRVPDCPAALPGGPRPEPARLAMPAAGREAAGAPRQRSAPPGFGTNFSRIARGRAHLRILRPPRRSSRPRPRSSSSSSSRSNSAPSRRSPPAPGSPVPSRPAPLPSPPRGRPGPEPCRPTPPPGGRNAPGCRAALWGGGPRPLAASRRPDGHRGLDGPRP